MGQIFARVGNFFFGSFNGTFNNNVHFNYACWDVSITGDDA